MLLSGVKYPKLAAGAGAVWILGRVLYAKGYTNTSGKNVDGSGRWESRGFHMSALSQAVFLLLVGKMGIDLLRV